MTLPVSGQISLSLVNNELSRGLTAQVALSEGAVRSLAGVASGQYGLSTLHGKSVEAPPPGPGPSPPPPPPPPTVFSYVMVPGWFEEEVGDSGTPHVISGFSPSSGIGSLSPTAFPFGTDIAALYYEQGPLTGQQAVHLWTTGAHAQMGAFSSLNINGTIFLPGDALWGHGGPGTIWVWNARSYNFATGQSTVIAVTQV